MSALRRDLIEAMYVKSSTLLESDKVVSLDTHSSSDNPQLAPKTPSNVVALQMNGLHFDTKNIFYAYLIVEISLMHVRPLLIQA